MYLALYRKYRPSTFDDVISQEHITTTLKNQIAAGQIAHAYLFTGTRGTGKTSCAKIMAKAVNCLSPKNGNPCGECEACRAIDSGSTDIIEIDAASNNGVDSIRQIRDEVIYTPIDCKYKVYIIDEVHMLTGAAFNALLKTLEEPPSHAVFILATTEYYKVPATILSRCQQFLFSKIDPVQSAQRLEEIAARESITLTPEAASLIARLSDGAMRDALSLLDQCISADSNVDEELVRRCSGSADSGYLFAVSRAAIDENPAEALAVLDKLINQGKDLSRFIEELTLHYRNLMLIKTVGRGLVKASDSDLRKYEEQCAKYSLDGIMRHIDLISDSLDSINRMKQTGQARLLSEQLLIRITSPKLTNDASALAARLGALEERVLQLVKNGISVAVPAAAVESDHKTEVDFAENNDFNGADASVEKIGGESNKTEDENRDVLPRQQSFAADEVGFDGIPLPTAPPPPPPPPPPEEIEGGGFEDGYFEPQITTDNAQSGKLKKAADDTLSTKQDRKAADTLPRNHSEKADHTLPPTKSEEQTVVDRAIGETDFELPDGTPTLPQWEEIVSGLAGSAGRLLKNSKAYLYGGKIYIEASTSAKTVLGNSKKSAAVRERTASVMGGSFDLFLLRERRAEASEKEDRITPFLDRARAMGIEVAVKEK